MCNWLLGGSSCGLEGLPYEGIMRWVGWVGWVGVVIVFSFLPFFFFISGSGMLDGLFGCYFDVV